MNFVDGVASGFRHYSDSTGRASRSEFWFWMLFAAFVNMLAHRIDHVLFPGSLGDPIYALAGLALFLPGLAVSARRLHDINRSGWWVLISLTGIGILLLIYWALLPGTQGENDFGPDPSAPGGNGVVSPLESI